MKLWVLLFAVALFAGGTCLGVAVDRTYLSKSEPAPERSWGGSPWEISVHHFVRRLGLTDEQDRELDRILGETQRDIEAYYRAIRSTHERSRERVTALLNEEQKRKLDELRDAEKAKRDQDDVRRSLRKYTAALQLDEAQQAKIRAILAGAKEKKRAFFRDQKSDGSGIRAFFRELREEQRKQFKAVLNADQYQRYSEMED